MMIDRNHGPFERWVIGLRGAHHQCDPARAMHGPPEPSKALVWDAVGCIHRWWEPQNHMKRSCLEGALSILGLHHVIIHEGTFVRLTGCRWCVSYTDFVQRSAGSYFGRISFLMRPEAQLLNLDVAEGQVCEADAPCTMSLLELMCRQVQTHFVSPTDVKASTLVDDLDVQSLLLAFLAEPLDIPKAQHDPFTISVRVFATHNIHTGACTYFFVYNSIFMFTVAFVLVLFMYIHVHYNAKQEMNTLKLLGDPNPVMPRAEITTKSLGWAVHGLIPEMEALGSHDQPREFTGHFWQWRLRNDQLGTNHFQQFCSSILVIISKHY